MAHYVGRNNHKQTSRYEVEAENAVGGVWILSLLWTCLLLPSVAEGA